MTKKRAASRKETPIRSASVRGHVSYADSTGDALVKVVRDSFTMPLADYALLGTLKKKCLGLGVAVKKSELLRAGLRALTRISDENLTQVLAALENVKTGRPPRKKKKKSGQPKRKKR